MAENLNSYADSVIEQKSDKEVAGINGQISGLDTRVTALEESGGGGGGSSFSPYIGTITDEDGINITCDKTFAEITAAVQAGKFIMYINDGLIDSCGYLYAFDDEMGAVFYLMFAFIEDDQPYTMLYRYIVSTDGTVSRIVFG